MTSRSHAEDLFLCAAQTLAQDPLYGVPAEARAVIARQGKTTKVAILGTHGCGSYLLDIPADERGCDIVAVVDDLLSKAQSHYHGVPLASSDQFLQLARQHGDSLIAVNTCRKESARRYFEQLCSGHGIACMNYEQAVRGLRLHGRPDYRVDDWGPDIAANIRRYQELALRLGDDFSVHTLFAVLLFHLTCEAHHVGDIAQPYGNLYFRSGLFGFSQHEKMVDCGASIGESLHGLIRATGGEFAHSWMIEPDRQNIRTLQALRDRLPDGLASRVSLHACGVGETAGRVPFQHEGGHGGAVLTQGSGLHDADMIDVLPVDQIIDDAPTFIKMDVEGSELAALKGAGGTLRAHRPKLAISAYHRASDLLTLTDYVLGQQAGYRIGLRHHTAYRWDTCLYFY